MFFILLSVICNVLLFVILKAFPRFNIPAIQGIVINYFVAGSTALFFIDGKIEAAQIFRSGWFPVAVLEGALFISIFYLLSVTSQKISIAVASVANKMSVVIPVIFSVWMYNDSTNWIKITGLVIALASVYLTVKPGNGTVNSISGFAKIILPLIVFLGSGIIDSIVTYAEKENTPVPLFIATCFFVAGTIGSIILLSQLVTKRSKFVPTSIAGGIILGIPNYFSIYFIMLALSTSGLQSSQVYPIVNTGVVLVSTVAGLFIFKEKLTMWNYTGILLSVIAIALIAGWIG